MAIKLLSMMMVMSAAAGSGVAAMAKAQEFYAATSMAPVLQALDTRGIAYKRTILMAVSAGTDKAVVKPS